MQSTAAPHHKIFKKRRAVCRPCFWVLWPTLCFFNTVHLETCFATTVACTFRLEMCFVPQRLALFKHLNYQKELKRLIHFDLQMRFVPQRRALLQHLNFQKCSEHVVFLPFRFDMCFAPLRRARFRHLNFQKCSDTEVLLGILKHWKNSVFRDFATFSRTLIFFLLVLLTLSLLTSSLLTLSLL